MLPSVSNTEVCSVCSSRSSNTLEKCAKHIHKRYDTARKGKISPIERPITKGKTAAVFSMKPLFLCLCHCGSCPQCREKKKVCAGLSLQLFVKFWYWVNNIFWVDVTPEQFYPLHCGPHLWPSSDLSRYSYKAFLPIEHQPSYTEWEGSPPPPVILFCYWDELKCLIQWFHIHFWPPIHLFPCDIKTVKMY